MAITTNPTITTTKTLNIMIKNLVDKTRFFFYINKRCSFVNSNQFESKFIALSKIIIMFKNNLGILVLILGLSYTITNCKKSSTNGNFDEIILTPDHVEGLKKVIEKLEK